MSEPSSSPEITFAQERRERLSAYGQDGAFQSLSQDWLRESMQRKYVYNFDWLGRPIIQYPQDMWAVQDLIWRVRPDLVIETGIAHGGSSAFTQQAAQLPVGRGVAQFDLGPQHEHGQALERLGQQVLRHDQQHRVG